MTVPLLSALVPSCEKSIGAHTKTRDTKDRRIKFTRAMAEKNVHNSIGFVVNSVAAVVTIHGLPVFKRTAIFESQANDAQNVMVSMIEERTK